MASKKVYLRWHCPLPDSLLFQAFWLVTQERSQVYSNTPATSHTDIRVVSKLYDLPGGDNSLATHTSRDNVTVIRLEMSPNFCHPTRTAACPLYQDTSAARLLTAMCVRSWDRFFVSNTVWGVVRKTEWEETQSLTASLKKEREETQSLTTSLMLSMYNCQTLAWIYPVLSSCLMKHNGQET